MIEVAALIAVFERNRDECQADVHKWIADKSYALAERSQAQANTWQAAAQLARGERAYGDEQFRANLIAAMTGRPSKPFESRFATTVAAPIKGVTFSATVETTAANSKVHVVSVEPDGMNWDPYGEWRQVYQLSSPTDRGSLPAVRSVPLRFACDLALTVLRDVVRYTTRNPELTETVR